MSDEQHYRRLESMYAASPINEFYNPTMEVEEGLATIWMDIEEKFFHSAYATHGSVYFKLLDDAAFFAANSLEPKFFVLTTSFTTYLTRPVSEGRVTAVGEVLNLTRSQFIAEAVIYDEDDHEIGRGSGIFVRSEMPLQQAMGYNDA